MRQLKRSGTEIFTYFRLHTSTIRIYAILCSAYEDSFSISSLLSFQVLGISDQISGPNSLEVHFVAYE